MRVRRAWLVWILLLFGATTGSGVAAGELRVLFIGNSLTYCNDLPAIVAALAEASKQRRFVYKSLERIDLPKREAGLLQVAADVTGRKR